MADSFVPVTFVADELLTSTKMNLLAANQAGFHDGTALGDGIIVTRHLGNNQVTEAKSVVKSSYTTDEVDTGVKWIDGKPVYRMTKNFTVPSATSGTEQTLLLTTYGFPTVASIINASAMIHPTTTDSPDGTFYSPNGYSAARGGHSFMTWSNNPYLYILGNGSARRLKITLWYTKP